MLERKPWRGQVEEDCVGFRRFAGFWVPEEKSIFVDVAVRHLDQSIQAMVMNLFTDSLRALCVELETADLA
jgi:hypothetical protein